MLFKSTNELPNIYKRYSESVQRQVMHVCNSVFKKNKSEVRAFKAANSVLKKRFKKKNSLEQNSHTDKFNLLIDEYLGNVKG